MTDFNELRAKIVKFFEDHPVDITSGRDPRTGEEWFKVEGLPKLPPEWAIAVGVIGHNARSALDHLVYALAFEGGGDPEDERTGFPIYPSREDYFRVNGRTKLSNRDMALAGVEERWRKKIDDLQPYQRGDVADRHPLATLVHITNRDKHKTTNAPHIALETPKFLVGLLGHQHPESMTVVTGLPGNPNAPFQVHAGNLGTKSRRHPQKLAFFIDGQQRANTKVRLNVAFGTAVNDKYVYPSSIKRAITRVEVILREFEPAFGP